MPKTFTATALVLLGILLVPLAVVVLLSLGSDATLALPPRGLSLRWYDTILNDPEWRTAILNSTLIATCATVIAITLFVPAGLAVGLMGRHQWLVAIFMSPFVIPPLVLALGLYQSLGQLRNTFWALPVAHALFAAPIIVLIQRNAVRSLNPSSLDAASAHGATLAQMLWNIVLPQLKYAIAASALITFLLSFNEPIFSLYLSTPWNQTLPVKVWGSLRFNVSPATAAVGTLSTIASVVLLIFTVKLLRRGFKNA